MLTLEKELKYLKDLYKKYYECQEPPEELDGIMKAVYDELISASAQFEVAGIMFYTLMESFKTFLEMTPYQTEKVRKTHKVITGYMERHPNHTKH
jgi:hypothetical protein